MIDIDQNLVFGDLSLLFLPYRQIFFVLSIKTPNFDSSFRKQDLLKNDKQWCNKNNLGKRNPFELSLFFLHIGRYYFLF